jgi:hypothetical protein
MRQVRDAIPKPQSFASAEFTTSRMRLPKIAARITETATRVRIAFAAACPEAELRQPRSLPSTRSTATDGAEAPIHLAPPTPGPAHPAPNPRRKRRIRDARPQLPEFKSLQGHKWDGLAPFCQIALSTVESGAWRTSECRCRSGAARRRFLPIPLLPPRYSPLDNIRIRFADVRQSPTTLPRHHTVQVLRYRDLGLTPWLDHRPTLRRGLGRPLGNRRSSPSLP